MTPRTRMRSITQRQPLPMTCHPQFRPSRHAKLMYIKQPTRTLPDPMLYRTCSYESMLMPLPPMPSCRANPLSARVYCAGILSTQNPPYTQSARCRIDCSLDVESHEPLWHLPRRVALQAASSLMQKPLHWRLADVLLLLLQVL
jgi:hypothetical protein